MSRMGWNPSEGGVQTGNTETHHTLVPTTAAGAETDTVVLEGFKQLNLTMPLSSDGYEQMRQIFLMRQKRLDRGTADRATVVRDNS